VATARIVCVALGLALGLSGSAARAAECLDCHAEKVDAKRFEASPHAAFGCAGCHAGITDFPHPDAPSKPNCAGCHADAVASHEKSPHGTARGTGSSAVACADCHGDVHALVSSAKPDSPLHWSKLAATCARCHARAEPAVPDGIPVARPVEAYQASVHHRAVTAGRRGAVCADCHGAHASLPATDPASPLARTNVAATCGRCHGEIARTYTESIHGAGLAAGHTEAATCTDCHGEHAILGHGDPASPVFPANIPGETCGRCHASLRLTRKYGLASGRVADFSESFHGLALRSGQLTAANCASCHGVHDIRPSSDPRSRVHPANLPATCGRCHPGAGKAFPLGPVHLVGQTGAAGGLAVAWIRFVYLWLIGVVVGAMAVHNGLDLWRKARRPTRAPIEASPPAERMTRSLRRQHGLLMVSFPALVYTGFALTYPEAWWARPVLAWETGFALRGTLHRLFALVLLGAVAWHFGLLAADRRLRACFRDILWARADLRELRARLAWMAGRRHDPPPTGTFGYAAKLEYWALLWGVALMAATGILLWFENATLRWLPKWVTDVATAIHFWEAVLATLAILVWHFYWVIFDPDVYPMDGAWWHGREPAARAAEHGPPPPTDD
jgi:cytochrome b subunit of formate dehydrogenase